MAWSRWVGVDFTWEICLCMRVNSRTNSAVGVHWRMAECKSPGVERVFSLIACTDVWMLTQLVYWSTMLETHIFYEKFSCFMPVHASSVELLVKEIVYGFWYSLDDVMEVIKEIWRQGRDGPDSGQKSMRCDAPYTNRMQLSYPSQRPSIFSFLSISSSARGSNYLVRTKRQGKLYFIVNCSD